MFQNESESRNGISGRDRKYRALWCHGICERWTRDDESIGRAGGNMREESDEVLAGLLRN